MKIYQLHPVSGDFMWESFADESPLEPGKYLIPAHSVLIAPPEFDPETQVCKWVGTVEDGSWNVFTKEEAIENSEPLKWQPTKEELEKIRQEEEAILNRKKAVLKKLGLNEQEMDDLLL